MADWNSIMRNSRKSGNFIGTTTGDQDAYFEFFSGDNDKGLRSALRKRATAIRKSVVMGLGGLCLVARTFAAFCGTISKDLAIR